MLLQGKVAIITGAASEIGIGWTTGKVFTEQGAKVALLDLDLGQAQKAAAAIGDNAIGLACDVRDQAACEAAVVAGLERFGRIDILVNNAGVSQPLKLLDITDADYDLVMDVSMRGSYNMTRAVVPHLRQQKSGAIVCIGSVAGLRGGGILGGPHYAAAKGAIHSFAKAVARELGPDGIRCNSVAPGLVLTNLLTGRMDDAAKKRILDMVPLGRNATARDIANACLFLSSDLSSFVTGTVLDVNGGFHIH